MSSLSKRANCGLSEVEGQKWEGYPDKVKKKLTFLMTAVNQGSCALLSQESSWQPQELSVFVDGETETQGR